MFANNTPFSPAGPIAATEPRPERAATVAPTPFPQRESAGRISAPASVMASTTGERLLPVTKSRSSPDPFSRQAKRPPAEPSQTVPVRGERETAENRAEVGASVPHRGPTAKMSGRSGSKGSSAKESRSRRTPSPRPPR